MWYSVRIGDGFVTLPIWLWLILMPLIIAAALTYYIAYGLVLMTMACVERRREVARGH